MSVLSQLRDTQARRSKSAIKLIAYILEDPATIVSMPIATLANAVSISEPTVNRFCTGLGFKGFPDFKLSLAAELGRAESGIASDIESADSISQVASKIFEATRVRLSNTQNHLDVGLIDQVVVALDSARSIVLCGLGASASVAMDAQHKLLRFDTPVVAHTDIINQRMLTTSLRAEDCLICISYTGRTTALCDIAAMTASSGATVVGLTDPDSPLAKLCDLVLGVDSGENTDVYTPMTSRIAQLTIIDVLATAWALRKGPSFSKHLQRVKMSLAGTRHAGN
jgi:RpiR family carbohydrate utilization transcriptional regulator